MSFFRSSIPSTYTHHHHHHHFHLNHRRTHLLQQLPNAALTYRSAPSIFTLKSESPNMAPPKSWAFSGSKKGTKHWAKVASMPRPGSRLGGCTAAGAAIGAPSSSSGVMKTVTHRKTPPARSHAIRTVRTNGGPSYEGGDYDVAPCVYKVQISTDFTPKTPSPVKKKLPGSKLRILGVPQKPTTTNTVVQGVEEGTLIDDRRQGFEITPHSWYDLPLFSELQSKSLYRLLHLAPLSVERGCSQKHSSGGTLLPWGLYPRKQPLHQP
jgi:hypothetical protein